MHAHSDILVLIGHRVQGINKLLGPINAAILVGVEAVYATLNNRIFDYLNCVSYIVSASVEYISDDLLMYAPAQVTVAKEKGVKRSSGLGSWLGK